MTDVVSSKIYEEILKTIDIPESAYEKAEARYKDLGSWFERSDSKCSSFSPRISPQGSFRLGTVIRPINPDDPYDLDLNCRLREGIEKHLYSQKQLKELVGSDVEAYRIARGIQDKKEEKRRCWRLNYADTLKFHMDIVPSIPETQDRRKTIQEMMIRGGVEESLSINVAEWTGAITDNERKSYPIISNDWCVSNSEGYALWFESRMMLARPLLEKRAFESGVQAQVDDLPAYRWKSPLQQCLQILKRHRDVLFAKNPDSKPISIILTTLAGRAYQGETDVAEALNQILSNMGSYVNGVKPRVPNPVNSEEDFSDKWSESKYSHLRLEESFWYWLDRAKTDLKVIGDSRNANEISGQVKDKLATSLDVSKLVNSLGVGGAGGLLKPPAAPSNLNFPDKPIIPSKPAGFAG